MYDAWAAYDPKAVGDVYRGKHPAIDVPAAPREAISCAAFQMLKERHVYSRTAQLTLFGNESLMTSLGYNTLGEAELTFTTRRGFKFQPQKSPDLNASFANDGPVIHQPFAAVSVVRTHRLDAPQEFFRVIAVE